MIVGNIGTQSALEPMMKAIDAGDKVTKSLVAAELYKLPISEEAENKFKEVYAEIGVNDKIPPDDYAKEALIDSAGSFFDPELNGWLFEDGTQLKGSKADVQGVQATLLGVAIKGATEEAVAVGRGAAEARPARDQGQDRQVLLQGFQEAEGGGTVHRDGPHRQDPQARDRSGHDP